VAIMKMIVPCLLVCALTAAVAYAQSPGGHRRGGAGEPPNGSAPSGAAATPATPRLKPVNQIEIVGVVKAIDPAADRITIAYDAVDALNWPPGTMPFVVSKAALLQGLSVGEKVRFRMDSEQIIDIQPSRTPGAAAASGDPHRSSRDSPSD
jgi:Cu/Ag efflux protein CusF